MSELAADEYHMLDHTEFDRLRTAIVTRLTIFNARCPYDNCRLGDEGMWRVDRPADSTSRDTAFVLYVMTLESTHFLLFLGT